MMAAVCVHHAAWGQSGQPQSHSESSHSDPGRLESSQYEEDFQTIRAFQQDEWRDLRHWRCARSD